MKMERTNQKPMVENLIQEEIEDLKKQQET